MLTSSLKLLAILFLLVHLSQKLSFHDDKQRVKQMPFLSVYQYSCKQSIHKDTGNVKMKKEKH